MSIAKKLCQIRTYENMSIFRYLLGHLKSAPQIGKLSRFEQLYRLDLSTELTAGGLSMTPLSVCIFRLPEFR
tara:strand:- start:845 stop:1060 length:216 start_codon:yes stop_codon:yes gene_type:complete